MIYINSELVDFNNRSEDYKYSDVVQDYHNTISELREKHGNRVKLKTRDNLRLDAITGKPKPYKGYSWRNQLSVVNGSTQQTWVYTSSMATIKDGVISTSDPNFRVDRGALFIDMDEESDRLFFLLKHDACKRKALVIDDPEADERKRADTMRQETRLRDLIYSEASPLFDDVDKLKDIARKWGISDCDTRSEASIRNSLYDIVQAGEDQKKKGKAEHGIQEFVEDTQLGVAVQIGSVVQKAIDKGILSFNRTSKEWLLIVDKDQMPLSIMMVSDSEVGKSRATLNNYLFRNRHDVETIEKALEGNAVIKYGAVHDKGTVKVDEVATLETIDDASWTEIQKTAKHLGVNIFKKKADDARSVVREKLLELAEQE